MTDAKVYYDQLCAVGSHGMFFSEVQTWKMMSWISKKVFPDAVPTIDNPSGIRRDFNLYFDLLGNPPMIDFFAPGGDDNPALKGKVHLLASVALDPTTALWGHADMFADRRDLSPVPRRVLEFGAQTKLDVFSAPVFYYAPPSASPEVQNEYRNDLFRYMGGIAAEMLGPGYFPLWKWSSDTSGYILLVSDLDPAPPAITLQEVFDALGEFVHIAAIRRYDFDAGMKGLARHLGWFIDAPAPQVWKIAPANSPEYIQLTIEGGSINLNRIPF